MEIKRETVKLNYLRIAPRKVRLIANTLKKLSVSEAEAQLLMRNQRSAGPLLKLLRSAVANAVHNKKMDPDKLFIEFITVDQGPSLKRFLPRAQGRATPILKKMSHITLTLAEKGQKIASRFNIISKKPEKSKKESKKKKIAAKPEAQKETSIKAKEKSGFFKKIFNRKSI